MAFQIPLPLRVRLPLQLSPTSLAPPDALRAARRAGLVSQRRLAEDSDVARAVIARIETGAVMPAIDLLAQLVTATGCQLELRVLGPDRVPLPRIATDDLSDRGGRRFPAHFEVREVKDPFFDWWHGPVMAPWDKIKPPKHTYDRFGWRGYLRQMVAALDREHGLDDRDGGRAGPT